MRLPQGTAPLVKLNQVKISEREKKPRYPKGHRPLRRPRLCRAEGIEYFLLKAPARAQEEAAGECLPLGGVVCRHEPAVRFFRRKISIEFMKNTPSGAPGSHRGSVLRRRGHQQPAEVGVDEVDVDFVRPHPRVGASEKAGAALFFFLFLGVLRGRFFGLGFFVPVHQLHEGEVVQDDVAEVADRLPLQLVEGAAGSIFEKVFRMGGVGFFLGRSF